VLSFLQSWIEGQPDSQKAKAHGGVVSTMCVHGRYLYTGSWDGVIQVWLADAPFGPEGPVATMQVEGGPLAVVHALAAGGGRLYSAHLDTGIKVRRRVLFERHDASLQARTCLAEVFLRDVRVQSPHTLSGILNDRGHPQKNSIFGHLAKVA
jgi:hypothetical protein